ncbi:MAG: hypothetical protein ACK5RX_05395 [bacterium]
MIADRNTLAFDTLTDLFLGPGGDAEHGEQKTPASERLTPAFELVVLGNLPGVASAWPGQYARTLHGQLGVGVALLYPSGGSLRVQLIGVPTAFVPADLSPATAVATALAHARRVLVVAGGPADEASLIADPRVQAATLLSGVDDASCVGAYRTIKRLATVSRGVRPPEKPGLSLRCACMGAPPSKARVALERLRESSASFLDVQLEASGVIERIEGGASGVMLFDGPCEQVLSRLLAEAGSLVPITLTTAEPRLGPPRHQAERSAIQLTNARADDQQQSPVVPTVLLRAEVNPLPHQHGGANEHGSHGLPRHEVNGRIHEHHQPHAPLHIHTHADVDAHPHGHVVQASDVNPVPASPPRPVGAVPHTGGVVPPGMSALPFHCPSDPELSLLVDAAGVPQVVGRAIGCDARVMVCRLVAAAGWMWVNRPLLAQVSAGSLRTDARPQMHLVTDDIAAARTLLESEVHVHAAVDVSRATAGVALLALN